MKDMQKDFDKRKDQIVNQILDLFRKYELEDDTKLIAVCECNALTDENFKLLYENQKVIVLENGFQNLSTRDKLIVIAASIKVHYQLTGGLIPAYGEILYYELINESKYEKNISFGTDGKIIKEDGQEI